MVRNPRTGSFDGMQRRRGGEEERSRKAGNRPGLAAEQLLLTFLVRPGEVEHFLRQVGAQREEARRLADMKEMVSGLLDGLLFQLTREPVLTGRLAREREWGQSGVEG